MVYLFRVDHQAKELVEARAVPIPINRASLRCWPQQVQIFVDPKEAKNLPAELKEKIREEEQNKGNML